MAITPEWIPVIAALIATAGGVSIAWIRTRFKPAPPPTPSNGWGSLVDQLQEEVRWLRDENERLRKQSRKGADE